MMRGIVVATTVWLRAPRNMASTTQVIDALACRFGGGVKPPSSSRPLSFEKTFIASQRVRLPLGNGTARRLKARIARRAATNVVKRA